MKTKNAKIRSLAGVAAAIVVCGIVNAQPLEPLAPDVPGEHAQRASLGDGESGYWSPVPGGTCPYFPSPGGPCYPL